MEKLIYAWGFLAFLFLLTGFSEVVGAIPEALGHFFVGTPIATLAGGSCVLLFGYVSGWITKTAEYEASVLKQKAEPTRKFKYTWWLLSSVVLGYAAYVAFDWSVSNLLGLLGGGLPRFLSICFFWLLCVFQPAERLHVAAESRRRYGSGTDGSAP
jgi:hypothetical protein